MMGWMKLVPRWHPEMRAGGTGTAGGASAELPRRYGPARSRTVPLGSSAEMALWEGKK